MNKGIFKFRVFRRRRSVCKVVAVVSAFAMLAVGSLPAFAATSVLNNEFGGASFNYIKGATHTQVDADHAQFTATGNGGLIDWQALNVGSGQGLQFTGSQFFNVVSGGNKSQIAGELKASGSMWIFNPAGVSFLDGANVTAGGLFAVATANLANQSEIESAIENGLDVIPAPQLGNLLADGVTGDGQMGAGAITADKGAVFVADRVALAGRTVNAAGDFKGVNNLAIGAADKMTVVDGVGGGKVRINISDFVDDVDALSVIGVEVVDDMDVGDTDHAGNVTVVTEGSINVKGAIKAEGDIAFSTLAKEDASAPVISYKKMSVASGKLLQGKSVSAVAAGDIGIEGEVVGEDGVSIEAGGDVIVDGGIVKAGKFDIPAGAGAPTIEEGDSANLTIAAGNGVVLKEGAMVGASGTAEVTANGASGVAVSDSTLVSEKDMTVLAPATETVDENPVGIGSLIISGAYVGTHGALVLTAAKDVSADSAATVESTGDLTITATDGKVSVGADSRVGTSGNLSVSAGGADGIMADGTLVADVAGKTATFTADNGSVKAKNEGNDFRSVAATAKDVSLNDKDDLSLGDVTATGGNVEVTAGDALTVAGTVRAVATDVEGTGGATLAAGAGKKISVDGAVDVDATAKFGSATDVNAGGSVKAETVDAEGQVLAVGAKDGETSAGSVSATGVVVATLNTAGTVAASEITVETEGSSSEKVAGTITQTDGTIAADTINGNVVQNGQDVEGTQIMANSDGKDGADVNGSVTQTKGTITAGKIDGDMTQNAANAEDAVLNAKEVTGTTKGKGTKAIETVKDVEIADGEEGTFGTINGTLKQSGGSVNAKDGALVVNGEAELTGGTTASTGDDVTFKDKLTQGADNTLNADNLTLEKGAEFGGTVNADKINAVDGSDAKKDIAQKGGVIKANEITAGTFTQTENGELHVNVITANVEQKGCTIIDNGDGTITVNGNLLQEDGIVGGSTVTKVTINGTLDQNAKSETADTAVIQADEVVLTDASAQGGNLTGDTIKATTLVMDDAGAVTLESAGNQIGKVQGTGGAVSVTTSTDLDLGAIEADSLTVKAGGKVTQSASAVVEGLVDVTAGGDVALFGTENQFGSVKAKGKIVEFKEKDDVVIAGIDASGMLLVQAGQTEGGYTKSISQTEDGAIKAAGGARFYAASVKLTNEENAIGPALSVRADDGNVEIVNNAPIAIERDDSTNVRGVTASGSVKLTAKDGDISMKSGSELSGVAIDLKAENGDISLSNGKVLVTADDGEATLTAANGAVVAANAENDFKGVTATAKSVELKDANDVTLTDVKATDGAVEVTAGGKATAAKVASSGATTVTAVGIDAAEVDAEGALTLDAKTGDLVVQTAVSGSSVELKGAKVSGAGSATADSSTLAATATGDGGIALTGVVKATGGEATLTAANGAVVAANAENDFKVVTATAKDGITLNDKDDIVLAEVKATGGDVRVRAMTDGLTVADADAVKVSGQDIRLEATAGAITIGAGVDGKNVTLKAGTTVETKKVEGTADGALTATGGDLHIDAGGDVTLAAAQAAVVGGDPSDGGVMAVVSGGKIAATGATTAKTLYTKDADGVSFESVSADGMAAKSGKDIEFKFTKDVEVAYESTGGKVDVESTGSVTVKSATVADEDLAVTEVKWPTGTEEVTLIDHADANAQINGVKAATTASVKSTGDGKDVTVETQVVGGEGVTLAAEKGNVNIGTDTAAGVVVKAGEFTNEATGEVKPGSSANLTVTAGNGVTVQNGATAAATGTADVTANGADGVTVKGAGTRLVADKSLTVKATAADADVEISGGAYVAARNSADGDATTISSENGSVSVSGAATAVEAGKNLTVAGKTGVTVDAAKVGADGTLKLEATGDNASVAVQSGARAYGKEGVTLDAKKDVTIDGAGTLVKAGAFTVDEATGAVTDADTGKTLAVTAGNAVKVANGAKAGASGAVDVDAGAGGVEVGGASALASNGAMTIDANGGAVEVKGGSKVASASTLDVGKDGATASLTVDGSEVVSKDALSAKVVDAIVVQNSGKVGSDAKVSLVGATVTAQTGAKVLAADDIDIDATGAVTVDGATVAAKKKVLVGDATTPSGSFAAQNGAAVTGLEGVDVEVSGTVGVSGATVVAGVVNPDGSVGEGSSADIALTAGKDVAIGGGATVAASGKATATAKGDDGTADKNGVVVTGAGTKLVADKSLTVQATTGDGSVKISDGAYVAARNSADDDATAITSENGSVTVSGAATAVEAGKNLTVSGMTGVTVDAAKAGADGTLKLEATGADASVAIRNGAKAYGKDGVTLASTSKDVTIDGSGTLVKAGTFTVDEATGEVTGADDGKKLEIAAGNGVKVTNGAKAGASGVVDVDADAGGVEVSGASALASNGAMTIDANGGVVEVKGGSKVASASTLDVGKDGATASLTVDGSEVVAKDNLTAKTTGAIVVQNSGKVGSDAGVKLEGASVTATGGAEVLAADDIDIDATGAVLVDGATVAAKKKVLVGDSTTPSGSFAAQNGAAVTGLEGVGVEVSGQAAVNGATVMAGVVNADGSVGAGSSADIALTAGKGVRIDGGATVAASGSAAVTAKGDDGTADKNGVVVTGTGTKLVADKSLTVQAITGDGGVSISDGAYVAARNSADGDATAISSENGSVSVSGSATAVESGKGLAISGKTGVTVDAAKAGADGMLKIDATGAEGSVAIRNGAKAYGRGGVTLGAKKDVAIDGSGTLVKAGTFTVDEATGEVTDADGGKELGIAAGNAVKLTNGAKAGASGAVDVDAGAGGVEVGGASALASNGAMAIDANGGAVEVRGGSKVTANGEDTESAKALDIQAGTTVMVQGGTVRAVNAGGSVAVKAGTGVVIEKGTQDAMVMAGKDVTIDTTSGNVTVGRAGDTPADKADASSITATSGNVVITANTAAGQSVTIRDAASVNATVGAVEVMATGAINVNDTTTVEAGTSVTMRSTGEGAVTVDTTQGVTAQNGNVTIDNDNGAVVVQNAKVEAKGANGSVDIDATTGVTIEKGTGTGAQDPIVKSENKHVLIDTTGGNITIKNATVTAGDNIHVATTDLTEGGNVTIDTGVAMTASKNATIIANKDVALNSDVTATAGDAYVAAQKGDVTMKNGTTIGAGNNVYLGAEGENGAIGVSKIVAGNAAWLKTSGDIVNGDIDGVHVEAKQLRLEAGGSIGKSQSNRIETDANNIEAVAKNGNVFIGEKDAITVGLVGDGNGKLVVKNVNASGGVDERISDDIVGISAEGNNGGIVDLKAGGTVTVGEKVDAKKKVTITTENGGNLAVGATVSAKDVMIGVDGSIVVNSNGKVSASNSLKLNSKASTTVNGSVESTGGSTSVSAGGNVNVNGTVSGGVVSVTAGNDVTFGASGKVVSRSAASVAAGGGITQEGSTESASGGYVQGKKEFVAAIDAAGDATLTAGSGSIGSVEGTSISYVGVKGSTVTASASGDVAIADASGSGLTIGTGGIMAGGDAAVYTAKSIKSNGAISGSSVTVSAKTYEPGTVSVSVGNGLIVNNFRNGNNPLLAIFESNGGTDRPDLENLPNKTIVFFDGRLLGGDIKTINTLGSVEAFPVQTPELKSEQGIFGNPTFLHDDLDVSNPMAVGAIDYLLLETPRLKVSDDFGLDIEEQLQINGLKPTTSYWFGQSAADEKAGDDGDDKKDEDNKPKATAP